MRAARVGRRIREKKVKKDEEKHLFARLLVCASVGVVGGLLATTAT